MILAPIPVSNDGRLVRKFDIKITSLSYCSFLTVLVIDIMRCYGIFNATLVSTSKEKQVILTINTIQVYVNHLIFVVCLIFNYPSVLLFSIHGYIRRLKENGRKKSEDTSTKTYLIH